MSESNSSTKQCCSCEHFLSADCFYKCSAKKDGLAAMCKDCNREYQKKYRENNREYFRERNRKERAENPSLNAARTMRWRDKNRGPKAAMNKAWREANKGAQMEHWQRRRARKQQAQGSHTFNEVWRMAEDQGWLCGYCEVPLFGVFHVDHILPLSRGGSDSWDNLAVTCKFCNLRKSTKNAEEYIEWLKLLSRDQKH
ncbi:MAG: HNH endonuclease [Rubrobacteraceae bacterium]